MPGDINIIRANALEGLTYICHKCGKEGPKTSFNQKLCADCRKTYASDYMKKYNRKLKSREYARNYYENKRKPQLIKASLVNLKPTQTDYSLRSKKSWETRRANKAVKRHYTKKVIVITPKPTKMMNPIKYLFYWLGN